jgi:DNA-binding MarR family transcriptional regulator
MIFNFLQRLNDLEQIAVPFIWTKVDREILIAVGAAQEKGLLLSLKQITLLGIASTATVRRRIAHLIDSGYLEKEVHHNDRRTVVYLVSSPVLNYMQQLGRELLEELANPGDGSSR